MRSIPSVSRARRQQQVAQREAVVTAAGGNEAVVPASAENEAEDEVLAAAAGNDETEVLSAGNETEVLAAGNEVAVATIGGNETEVVAADDIDKFCTSYIRSLKEYRTEWWGNKPFFVGLTSTGPRSILVNEDMYRSKKHREPPAHSVTVTEAIFRCAEKHDPTFPDLIAGPVVDHIFLLKKEYPSFIDTMMLLDPVGDYDECGIIALQLFGMFLPDQHDKPWTTNTLKMRKFLLDELRKDVAKGKGSYFKSSEIMKLINREPGTADLDWNGVGIQVATAALEMDMTDTPGEETLFNLTKKYQKKYSKVDCRHLEVYARATKTRIVLLYCYVNAGDDIPRTFTCIDIDWRGMTDSPPIPPAKFSVGIPDFAIGFDFYRTAIIMFAPTCEGVDNGNIIWPRTEQRHFTFWAPIDGYTPHVKLKEQRAKPKLTGLAHVLEEVSTFPESASEPDSSLAIVTETEPAGISLEEGVAAASTVPADERVSDAASDVSGDAAAGDAPVVVNAVLDSAAKPPVVSEVAPVVLFATIPEPSSEPASVGAQSLPADSPMAVVLAPLGSETNPIVLFDPRERLYLPNPRLSGLFLMWDSGHKTKHFTRDAFFCQRVLAEELKMKFAAFLSVRGWIVVTKVQETGPPKVSITYSPIDQSLVSLKNDALAIRYRELSETLERIYQYLNSSTVGTAPMVFSTRDMLAMPPDGKVATTDHRGRQKLQLVEQQHLQLALSTMKVTFEPVLDDLTDPLYLEGIFPLVFNECRTKRELLQGLQNLLMYCPDTETVNRNKLTLLEWLKDPATILQRAASMPKLFDSLTEYFQDIMKSLPKLFPKTNRYHRLRKLPQERIVTRHEVFLRLKQMDARTKPTIVTKPIKKRVSNKRPHTDNTDNTDEEDEDDNVMGDVAGPDEEEASVGDGERKRLRRSSVPGNIVDGLPVQPSPLVDDRYQPLRRRDHPPNRENSTLEIEYDSLLRWEEQPVVASDLEMRSVTARLVVEGPEFDFQLYHAPIELYVAWDLHRYYHMFEVLEKQQTLDQLLCQERSTLIIPTRGGAGLHTLIIPTCGGAGLHTCKPLLVVARPGCAIFEDYFPAPSFFELDLTMLVKFIFKHGKSDQIRSAPGGSSILKVLGSRFDFGNAGQARDLTVQEFRPLDLCGCEVLKDPQNSSVRLCIGKILDAMWQCSQTLSEKVVGRCTEPTSTTTSRFLEYASKLQDFLGASKCRTEWVTLQLLNLSHLQGGYRHKDVSNDPREGFNHSIVFCIHFTDAVGDLWSLKVITGFRKRVGDYLSGPYSKLDALKEALVQQLGHIDQQYQFLIGQRNEGLASSTFPTWQDYALFWLDDLMPYTGKLLEAYPIHGLKPPAPVKVQVLRLTASSTRCYWMSTALSGVLGYSPWLDARGMIQLGLLAVCQPAFCHFYVVTEAMKEAATSDTKDDNPIATYYQTFHDLFCGTFESIALPTIEADSEGRDACYQPTVGLNWRQLARDSTERDLLVDELFRLLTQVNSFVSGRLIPSFEDVLVNTNIRIEQNLKIHLGTFRLLLFVQFCAHLRVVIEPGKYLRRMFFPIKGSVAYQRIVDKEGFPATVLHEVCRFLKSELSTSSRRVFMDEIETMLCDQCEEGHVNELDTFIKGQSLFRLDDDGKPLVKLYGRDSEWTDVPLLKGE